MQHICTSESVRKRRAVRTEASVALKTPSPSPVCLKQDSKSKKKKNILLTIKRKMASTIQYSVAESKLLNMLNPLKTKLILT